MNADVTNPVWITALVSIFFYSIAFGLHEACYPRIWSTEANATLTGAKVAWNQATNSGWESGSIGSLALFIVAQLVYCGYLLTAPILPGLYENYKAASRAVVSTVTFFLSMAVVSSEATTMWKNATSPDPLFIASVVFYCVHLAFWVHAALDLYTDIEYTDRFTNVASILSIMFLVVADFIANAGFISVYAIAATTSSAGFNAAAAWTFFNVAAISSILATLGVLYGVQELIPWRTWAGRHQFDGPPRQGGLCCSE